MGLEEQKEEREVLDSIFPDEITDISDTEYRISISLEEPGAENNNDPENETEPPVLILRIQYPPTYPDVAPDLDISAPPNAPKHALLDIQEDKAALLTSLKPVIEENLGMAMVFTLVSALKEDAEALMGERAAAVQAVRDREAAKAEEEENRKFVGTKVTRETFLEWRARFREESALEEKRRAEERELEDKKKRVAVVERKLTGKELWERGLAGKDEEDDEENGLAEGAEKLKMEA